jgi:hypothetical protein
LSCAGLQGDFEENAEQTFGYFREEPWQFVVFEPGGFSFLRSGSESRIELVDWVV